MSYPPKRLRMRRKSSNFRPSYYYDTSLINKYKKGNMELLPIMVLLKIFSYLNTKDLLSVCVTSKLFYLPAITQLYSNVLVIEDQWLLKTIGDISDHLVGCNVGTIVGTNALPKLIDQASKHRKLNKQMNSLKVISNRNLDISRLVNSSYLKEFIFPELDIFDCLYYKSDTLVKMSITVKDTDSDVIEFPHLNVPKLKHLNIFYENKPCVGKKFGQVAKMLVDKGIIQNLYELELHEFVTNDIESLNQFNSGHDLTIWIEFLTQLSVSTESQSDKLKKLSLDGFIGKKGLEICRMLNQVFDLGNIVELHLNTKEFSHPNESHYLSHHTNLLHCITHYCQNLKTLKVNPTYDCLLCQFENLTSSLITIKNQLVRLNIKFECFNLNSCKQLLEVIRQYQPNLEQITIYDKSSQYRNDTDLIKAIGRDHFEKLSRLNLIFDQAQTLDLNSNYMRINLTNDIIKDIHLELSQYMINYLKTIEFNPKLMTKLNRLSVNNIELLQDKTGMYFNSLDRFECDNFEIGNFQKPQ